MRICVSIGIMIFIVTLITFSFSTEQSAPSVQNEDSQKKEPKSSEPVLHAEETIVVTATGTRKR